MKIIILTQYYPPEVGAPQFRISDMAVRLSNMDNEVTVMTAMPNYPQMSVHKDYRGKYFVRERKNGVDICRSWIYANPARSFGSRMLTYFSFLFSSLLAGLYALPRADVIICESPPLFLGITAWLLAKAKGAKLIFNVSDIWPESAVKLGLVTNQTLISLSERLEHFMYKRSVLVSCQTNGICKNINQRYPEIPTYWWRNGIDVDGFNTKADRELSRKEFGFRQDDFVILYAGILGHAQGLEVILHAAKILQGKNVVFFIVGDGPEKDRVVGLCGQMQLDNVVFHDVVNRSKMSEVLAAADASVIPLRKIDLFKGAIPSKIFESLIMRKPLLLGVDGEARDLFIETGRCGIFFEPENARVLADQSIFLKENPSEYHIFAENAYNYVVRNFSRAEIAKEYMERINQAMNQTRFGHD
jgi:glycosyltransferase involved in cell wall biosynthesis